MTRNTIPKRLEEHFDSVEGVLPALRAGREAAAGAGRRLRRAAAAIRRVSPRFASDGELCKNYLNLQNQGGSDAGP